MDSRIKDEKFGKIKKMFLPGNEKIWHIVRSKTVETNYGPENLVTILLENTDNIVFQAQEAMTTSQIVKNYCF